LRGSPAPHDGNASDRAALREKRGKAERCVLENCVVQPMCLRKKMSKLNGKIAVITGGNSGIGLARAKVFVKEGARVYFTGRRQAELDAAAAVLGPSATPVQGDVSKPADLDRLYDQIRNEAGRVDVVFANAGGVIAAPLGSLTEEHIDYHLDVHVKGVIWTVQKALPLMGPGGSIILNASIVDPY
jgi:NAD(P)-dependent dehydrogenase (short-subunit alcohol dehydrogenase family)